MGLLCFFDNNSYVINNEQEQNEENDPQCITRIEET